MGYGISPERGLIRKPNKSELRTELRSMITKKYSNAFAANRSSQKRNYRFHGICQKTVNKKAKPKNIQRFFHVSGAHSAFFSSHAIRWILFLMCTEKRPSKKVSEDEERQVKAQKQLFQVLINLHPWKLINSGLYQGIRQHYNNSYK